MVGDEGTVDDAPQRPQHAPAEAAPTNSTQNHASSTVDTIAAGSTAAGPLQGEVTVEQAAGDERPIPAPDQAGPTGRAEDPALAAEAPAVEEDADKEAAVDKEDSAVKDSASAGEDEAPTPAEESRANSVPAEAAEKQPTEVIAEEASAEVVEAAEASPAEDVVAEAAEPEHPLSGVKEAEPAQQVAASSEPSDWEDASESSGDGEGDAPCEAESDAVAQTAGDDVLGPAPADDVSDEASGALFPDVAPGDWGVAVAHLLARVASLEGDVEDALVTNQQQAALIADLTAEVADLEAQLAWKNQLLVLLPPDSSRQHLSPPTRHHWGEAQYPTPVVNTSSLSVTSAKSSGVEVALDQRLRELEEHMMRQCDRDVAASQREQALAEREAALAQREEDWEAHVAQLEQELLDREEAVQEAEAEAQSSAGRPSTSPNPAEPEQGSGAAANGLHLGLPNGGANKRTAAELIALLRTPRRPPTIATANNSNKRASNGRCDAPRPSQQQNTRAAAPKPHFQPRHSTSTAASTAARPAPGSHGAPALPDGGAHARVLQQETSEVEAQIRALHARHVSLLAEQQHVKRRRA